MGGWGTSLVGYASTVNLLQSLRMEFDDGAVYVVGPTVRYAVFVDRGTSKMEGRPFAKPAAERVQANLETEVDRILEGDILGADEDAIVRSAALAVEREMKRIITQKGAVDTGAMRASVTVEKVS